MMKLMMDELKKIKVLVLFGVIYILYLKLIITPYSLVAKSTGINRLHLLVATSKDVGRNIGVTYSNYE